MPAEDIKSVLPGKGVVYNPSFVGLIGISLNTNGVADDKNENGGVATNHPDIAEIALDVKQRPRSKKHGLAVIYAYAYDGHIYPLDSPRIMAVPWGRGTCAEIDAGLLPGLVTTNSGGTGKGKNNEVDGARGLKIWPITKHQQVIEVSINVGPAEALVLEANLPGNRTATSYRSTMQIATSHSRLG